MDKHDRRMLHYMQRPHPHRDDRFYDRHLPMEDRGGK